jgi:tocopherol cyclase
LIAPKAGADRQRFGVWAGDAVAASDRAVYFHLGPDASLDVELRRTAVWPRRRWGGSGFAHLVPGLPQYWHPWLLGGDAVGEATIDGETISLGGAQAYAEKNWGRAFPGRWWWGQAHIVEAGDVCVAFAGGPVRITGLRVAPTVLALRIEDRLISLAPPLAATSSRVGAGAWSLRTRSPGYFVEIEGDAAGSTVGLPVPSPDRLIVETRSDQALAGRMRILARARGRTLLRAESALAGLEHERGVPRYG